MYIQPTISVVIPAYNAEKYLSETITSVLAQTIQPHEVIIVDDGSKDRTIEIANKFPVKVICQENGGPAKARNTGINSSHGDWIAFLDADDTWSPAKIEKTLRAIEMNPDSAIIATNMFVGCPENGWTSLDLAKKCDSSKAFFPQLYRRSFLATSTLVVKKSAILDAGGFDSAYFGPEDYDLWLKITYAGGKIHFINEYLTNYRVHGASITSDPSRMYNDTQLIIKKYKKLIPFRLYFTRCIVLHLVIANIFLNQKKFKKAVICYNALIMDIITKPIDYLLMIIFKLYK